MFLFSAAEKNEVLLIFNIFLYFFIYSFFFFFSSLLSITARDRIAKNTDDGKLPGITFDFL